MNCQSVFAFDTKQEDSSRLSKIINKKVAVGLSIAQIFKIDGAATQFSASGYIYYFWKDSSLIYQPKDPSDSFRIVNKAPNSEPMLEFVNGKDIKYEYESELLIKPNGLVINKKKFDGTFFSPMNLRRFPFDDQNLEFIIEPFLMDTNYCILRVIPELVTLGKNVHQDEWDLSKPKYNVSVSHSDPTGQAPFSRLIFEIKAERKWNYYVWNIMLYLFIFVLISTGVYFVPPSDIRTSVRITLTMLLTVIAFHITLTDRIPALPYRTFMDDLDYLSVVAILYNFVLIFVNRQLLIKEKKETVKKIVRHHQIFYIPMLILVFFILLLLRVNFYLD